jgi:putative transposase
MSRRAQVEIEFRTWGGKRKGAGRPPAGRRSSERHKRRVRFERTTAVHCTLRVVDSVRSLRRRHCYAAIRKAMLVAGRRADFRITHISLERDHVHVIVEADSHAALAAGMQGFEISAARRLNQAIGVRRGRRRRGRVFADRYFPRLITSPTQARRCIAYVLGNWRRHRLDRQFPTWSVDYFSSAPTWTGWKELARIRLPLPAAYEPLPVVAPQTWLLSKGYERGGPPISWATTPGPPT